MGPYQVLPLPAKVDLGAMALKEYSTFLKAPVFLEPYHQIGEEVLPLCREAVGLFYNRSRLGKPLENQGRTHTWHSSMDLSPWTCQFWPTIKKSFTSALCGHWLQFGRLAGRDGWEGRMKSESQGNPSCLRELTFHSFLSFFDLFFPFFFILSLYIYILSASEDSRCGLFT